MQDKRQSWFRAAAIAIAVLVSPPLMAQAAPAAGPAKPVEKLPASAFAQLPAIEDATLSPSGTYMAGLMASGGRQILALMPAVGDRSSRVMLAMPEQTQFASLTWVGDDHLLVRLTTLMPVETSDWYVTRYIAVNRKTGEVTRLLWNKQGQGADLLWVPDDGSTEVLMAAQNSIYIGDQFWPAVYRVDVATGKTRTVAEGRTNVWEWGADHRGQLRYGITYNDTNTSSRLLYRGEKGGGWQTVSRATLRDDEELRLPLYFIPGTDRAAVIAEGADGKSELQEIDLATGAKVATLFRDEAIDIEAVRMSRDGSRVLGVYTGDTARPVHWIDPAMAKYQATMSATSPKSTVSITSINRDQTKMLVQISTPDNPGLLFFYDAVAGSLAKLVAQNETIGSKRLSRARMVTYKARDGLEIEAVLTLPRGREAKALPFIIMPHGGPWAHDTLSYDYWAQYLAELGYGVIQPNFRGSTGYGEAFMKKGEGQIGLAMQDDKSDALAWAVREGLADPKRVCIVGASYGGYAAMWGVAREPDLYRCSISIAGVSNMRKEASDFGDASKSKLFRTQWARMSSDFAAVSPINFVERIKVPMLLIHGKKDVTVNHRQSETMASAMRRAGKPVEFLSLPEADHYFTRQADRLALLEAMGAFLKKHNPPE